MLRLIAPEKKAKGGLAGDLDAAVEAMKSVPWTALQELKGDSEILKKIDDVEVSFEIPPQGAVLRQSQRPRFRPKVHSAPPSGVSVPETCWPSLCSGARGRVTAS